MEDQKSVELMQVRSEHRWSVIVGKKEYILDGNQIEILKEMSLAGKSSIVWFGKFAISIPHISSMERLRDMPSFTDFDKLALERIEHDRLE